MPWITIDESDVLTAINGKELAAYRAAALAEGQADPVAPVILQVIDQVRGYVAGCKANQLGAGASIPSRLLVPALDLIAVRIPQRVGRDPKPGRKDAAAAAIALLEQVAACKYDVESPATVSAEAGNSPSPRITAPVRTFDRDSQSGL